MAKEKTYAGVLGDLQPFRGKARKAQPTPDSPEGPSPETPAPPPVTPVPT